VTPDLEHAADRAPRHSVERLLGGVFNFCRLLCVILKMATLNALQSISGESGSGQSIPLEAIAAAVRTNDRLASSLKLLRSDRLHCCLNAPSNCPNCFVHK
jgi:hypothetical protein